jgi:hypothetical protein
MVSKYTKDLDQKQDHKVGNSRAISEGTRRVKNIAVAIDVL